MLSFLVVSWFLNFGYVPDQMEIVNSNITSIEYSDASTTAEIGLTATFWKKFSISGSVETFQMFNFGDDGYVGFYPYRADYKISCSYKFNDNVSLNASHECDHPIGYYPDGQVPYNYLSEVTKVYLHFEGGTSF